MDGNAWLLVVSALVGVAIFAFLAAGLVRWLGRREEARDRDE